ncbi:hypothetical protein ABPG74_011833 [Tetrahymena malaccensis]
MNILQRFIQNKRNCSFSLHSLTAKNIYNYRPFQDVLDNQILGNLHKFNQDIYMNQKQIEQFSEKIFNIHSSQNLIFLFRLFKLFRLTNDQFDQLYQAQRRKYQDFHRIRMQAVSTTIKIADQKQKQDQIRKRNESMKENNENEDDRLDEFDEEGDAIQKQEDQKSYVDNQKKDRSVQAVLSVLYKQKKELEQVIWQIENMHSGRLNIFLYHIFMNKQLNKLIDLGLDLSSSSDYHFFIEAYNQVERSKVTAEQMILILQILSNNPRFEELPNIFEGELENIVQCISNKQINYSLGKFIIRLGINDLIQRGEEIVGCEQSGTFDLVNPLQIHLDSLSLSLFLFDLKNKVQGIDVNFFVKFNMNDILQKLSLEEIDQLISALIEHKRSDSKDLHKDIILYLISQIIENSMIQAQNFKIYNDTLLNQTKLVVKYRQFADLNALTSLLNQISSEIINQTAGRAQLSNTFTNYISEFLDICPHDLCDFFQLFETFFLKQKVEAISYKQLLIIYRQMALTGVDYEEYLQICSKVFSSNKNIIIQENLHEQIISLAEKLHDVQTGNIFEVTIGPKPRLPPDNIEFLSDLSESEGEDATEEKGQKKSN